jgi:hypothetical protein
MINQVQKSEDAEICKRILAVMSLVYRPITLDELAALVELPDILSADDEALKEIISVCGSFLTLRGNVIVFVHQSAKEFLLEKARIKVLPTDIKAEHLIIFSRSLQTMIKTLRRNIFDLESITLSIKEITKPSPSPLAAAKYTCEYWVDHLQEGWSSEDKDHSLDDDSGYVARFLRQSYLHWLEALGILGSLPLGITAMLKLEDLLQVSHYYFR